MTSVIVNQVNPISSYFGSWQFVGWLDIYHQTSSQSNSPTMAAHPLNCPKQDISKEETTRHLLVSSNSDKLQRQTVIGLSVGKISDRTESVQSRITGQNLRREISGWTK